jgi:sec-independent protein translocase protein TatA
MINTLAWMNPEIAIIALAGVLVLFGGKKIPELMRGIGQGVGELKKGMDEGRQHLMSAIHEEPKPVVTAEPKLLPKVEETTPA